ncbi:MAG: protein kinase [Sandaracinaceae bacterium]
MILCPQCGSPNDDSASYCEHCGAEVGDRVDPLIGRTVGGAYLLNELVGVGGMGRVYRAEQHMLGRTVAVKVIHPHLLGDDQTVARFYNEARAASRLNHPNSVGIIDFGRTEDGILYLVMEHLAGSDLAHVLAEEGPLPFPRICRILRHVLSALGEAHSLGVVHRDLKPENVIVRPVRRGAEQIKVVDFGLAHIVGPGGTSITTPGLVCGTPDYMSPEQGKGETVDGRGDLYSMGVVLFEMLTDRLPFEDETPTKVVFKHIHDPVPDPREVAPYREIPDVLATLCMKALQKKAPDRFQSADQMYEAIQRAETALDAVPIGEQVVCSTCGATNPPDQKYCGDCGAGLTGRFSMPPQATTPPVARISQMPEIESPLVGRDAELERLNDLREACENKSLWASIVGEPGVGRTRLLREFQQRLEHSGDALVEAHSHSSGARVPFWVIRCLLERLLDADEERLREIVTSGSVGDPLARAGIAEVLRPEGLPGRPGASRTEAVAIALAAAVRVAAGRAASGRVTLLVDDLDRCDGLTPIVLQRTVEILENGPLLLVTTGTPTRGRSQDDSVKLHLRGLDEVEAQAVLLGEGTPVSLVVDRNKDTSPASQLQLPLYLHQLRALGHTAVDGVDDVPPRVADAVLARLERLDYSARRLLQGIAVFGDSVPTAWIEELARPEDLPSQPTLIASHLIRIDGHMTRIAHPYVRELIESSIPKELRKELHAKALEVSAEHGSPLEVRAEHAFRAGEPMMALLLLERMGNAALQRGDGGAAVQAFRRGLEFARRELLFTGETSLDRAIVTFSRKLGDALDSAGDSTGADGVLREALALAGPASRERPRMLMVLSRVATRRNRARDATRFLGQALELCAEQQDKRGQAEANLELGRLRLADGDAITAGHTLERVISAARALRDGATLHLDATLALARARLELDDDRGAVKVLESVRPVAEELEGQAPLADLLSTLAEVFDGGLDRPRAPALYREAARLAAESGDADRARSWGKKGRQSEAAQSA